MGLKNPFLHRIVTGGEKGLLIWRAAFHEQWFCAFPSLYHSIHAAPIFLASLHGIQTSFGSDLVVIFPTFVHWKQLIKVRSHHAHQTFTAYVTP